jgi:cytochrome c553
MSPGVARWLKTVLPLVAVVAVGAALVLVGGLVPIKASSGHWSVTHQLLDFIKRRSVATHSLGTSAPRLDDPVLVLHGAGTYDTSCRPCHGSPESTLAPMVPAAMTPPPPHLPTVIASYDRGELFFIVKHGIKFTGMPGWPTQERDDEVWAMVAFLLEMPKLDADAYRDLARGGAAPSAPGLPLPELAGAARAVTASCANCHSGGGPGRGLGAFPNIAGQKQEYLRRALDAYAAGRRPSGAMGPIAAALSEQERSALAHYYATLPPGTVSSSTPGSDAAAAARVQRGALIAEVGIAEQGVPSCRDCHGPGPHPRNPAYPNLHGQYANYLLAQLELFKSGVRGGSAYSEIMSHVAGRLTRQQMEDVTAYYASLAPNDSLGATR